MCFAYGVYAQELDVKLSPKHAAKVDQTKKAEYDALKKQYNYNLSKDSVSAQKKMYQKELMDQLAEHSEQFDKAQKELTKMKSKYSKVVNSNDMTTAVKRNSLKGKPLGKRLVYGGNFNLSGNDPIKVDLSPLVGYKVNKKLTLGLSGTYRQTFQKELTSGEAIYGSRLFANYDIFKNFFAAGEVDQMRTGSEMSRQ